MPSPVLFLQKETKSTRERSFVAHGLIQNNCKMVTEMLKKWFKLSSISLSWRTKLWIWQCCRSNPKAVDFLVWALTCAAARPGRSFPDNDFLDSPRQNSAYQHGSSHVRSTWASDLSRFFYLPCSKDSSELMVRKKINNVGIYLSSTKQRAVLCQLFLYFNWRTKSTSKSTHLKRSRPLKRKERKRCMYDWNERWREASRFSSNFTRIVFARCDSAERIDKHIAHFSWLQFITMHICRKLLKTFFFLHDVRNDSLDPSLAMISWVTWQPAKRFSASYMSNRTQKKNEQKVKRLISFKHARSHVRRKDNIPTQFGRTSLSNRFSYHLGRWNRNLCRSRCGNIIGVRCCRCCCRTIPSTSIHCFVSWGLQRQEKTTL